MGDMRLSYAKPTDSPALYIQCKGLHSGKPLKDYIPNSFAVYTEDPNAFAKCFALWKTRKYQILIKGSVIPFITIYDTRKLHREQFPLLANKCPKRINAIQLIEDVIHLKEKDISSLKEMQHALASELVKPP
jgi:hypothetical protein